MVTVQSIKEQFDELGIEPSEEVISKCIEICLRNDVDDPVEFVEQWMAYSVSKLSGAEPTVEYLRDMESHEYSASSKHHRQQGSSLAAASAAGADRSYHHPELREDGQRRRQQQQQHQSKGQGGPGGDSGLVIYSNAEAMSSLESDVLGSYGCITPKAKKPVSRLHGQTPDRNKAHFSPASYSPIASSKRSDPDGPSNSGNVVYTFGNALLLKQTSWSSSTSSSSTRRTPLSIGVQLFKGGQLTTSTSSSSAAPTFMSDECKYMYDCIYDRVLTYGDRIYEGGRDICLRLKANDAEATAAAGEEESIPKDDREATMVEKVAVHHVDFPSTEPIRVLGRIVVHPERTDGRLAIVDFDEHTLRCTKLNFSRMKSWAVFPGQTVLLEGINPRGNAFEVRQIHYERMLELPVAPMNLGKELNLVIAAAPFTEKDDLLYEKLSDLLTYCTNNQPDVLILTGPFGASSNPLFATIAEPFDVYFEKIMVNIMNSVPPTTEVLVVSNHDDIMSMFVYPSFPYKISAHNFKNLHFLPDPCVVTINGLELAITTADIIKDLTDAECSGNPLGDRIKRAFNYVFHHRSFYPLNPPPDTVPLDVDLLSEFGQLPRVPNMMICPGDLKCYVRDVNGCVCINPGHLVDHESGEGTFARVLVHPPEASTTSPYNYVACQVVKS